MTVPTPEATLAELEPLVEVSQAAQEEIRVFRERYDRLGRDAPLPPRSLRALSDGRRRYLNLQTRLVEIAGRYAPLAAPGAGSDLGATERFHALSVSLLAALTLYDNYLSMLTILEDDRLRRLVRHPSRGFGLEADALREQLDALSSRQAREELHRLLDAWTEAHEPSPPDDPTSVRLTRAIESSVSYRYARTSSLVDRIPTTWRTRRTRFLDALDGLANDALGAVSKAFGNGIGVVETRKGKLWDDADVRRRLQALLRPLDLLLEKTPFRLTDFFIPGHFGHVAIWMGTDAELEALGVWSEPAMQQAPLEGHRSDIRAGRSVLEALRPGVELNTLRDFLNVDDLAVLRPTKLTPSEVVESLVRGFEQVGKEYDFNFDVETTGSIVCSELPYHVYPGVAWQTEAQLGRFTISPDDVAAQALSEDGAFELILLVHDGEEVESADALSRMRALMRDA